MMWASVTTAPTFAVTRPEALFLGSFVDDFQHPMYDVSPDGQTFAMLRRGPTEGQVVVVLDWLGELRARLSAPR